MYIKGVNLGDWLVLEKWMCPAVFRGTSAGDEYYLPTQLPADLYEDRIGTHRAEFITERDFIYLKSTGINSVRIPVPYFVFGDRAPFIGCIEQLDQAFCWAEKYGIKILLDLHTTPDNQNGFDNGGIAGVCKWAQEPWEVEFVHTVLERLSERYGRREGLLGIETLNEPMTEEQWEITEVQKKYPPADPEKAKGSKGCSMEFLQNFYADAYDRMRKYLPEDKMIVFHDSFSLKPWKEFVKKEKFRNIIMDTHNYLIGLHDGDSIPAMEDYLREIKLWGDEIAEMKQYAGVIVGEWCLFNSIVGGLSTHAGQAFCDEKLKRRSPEEIRKIYREIADAQLSAWRKGDGYYFWSYKLNIDTVNTPGWEGWDAWDFGRCYDFGWLPKNLDVTS